MITNVRLVEHAKRALSEKWGYVWGTFGQTLTGELFQQKKTQYPEGVGNYETFIRNTWWGKKVTDCVGLIKGAYWSESGKLVYNGNTDVSADMMLSIAKEKGNISSIPEIPGICVWKPGHIGIYIGNGQVIEAKGTQYGVIQSKLSERGFVHWLKCPYVNYTEAPKVIVNPPINGKIRPLKVIHDMVAMGLDNKGMIYPVKEFYTGDLITVIGEVNRLGIIDINGVRAYITLGYTSKR